MNETLWIIVQLLCTTIDFLWFGFHFLMVIVITNIIAYNSFYYVY